MDADCHVYSLTSLFFLQHLLDLDHKHLSHDFFLVLLVVQHISDYSLNLTKDSIFALVSVNALEQVVVAVLNTKCCQPFVERTLFKVKADNSVYQSAIVISVLIN